MTAPSPDLVTATLRDPDQTAMWTGREWSVLLQQARASGLLARVAACYEDGTGIRQDLPAQVAAHMDAAERVCMAQHTEIHREVRHLQRALRGLDAPIVLLKGAAYVMAGLPAARGRVFSDIDIMVPKRAVAQAESLLVMHGWMSDQHSSYYQRYYREWMHELPPMHHVQRGTVLDLHHTILPETARLKPDPAQLFAHAVPLPGNPQLHVLCPIDMLLHSMTHLFMNDDMTHGLRDLSDMDLLLRHFAGGAGFWTGVVERANALDLTRPLFYGLRYTTRLWGTDVPSSVMQEVGRHAPSAPVLALMDAIWLRVLRSGHQSAATRWKDAALGLLFVRAHWLRMPRLLLARHLLVKALRLEPEAAPPAERKSEPKGG